VAAPIERQLRPNDPHSQRDVIRPQQSTPRGNPHTGLCSTPAGDPLATPKQTEN